MEKTDIEKYLNIECYLIIKGFISGDELAVQGVIKSVNSKSFTYIFDGKSFMLPITSLISVEEVE